MKQAFSSFFQVVFTRFPWMKPFLAVFAVVSVWRVFYLVISLYAFHKIPLATTQPEVQPSFFMPLLQWDSHFYLWIAENGYGNGLGTIVAFWPLFPLGIFVGTVLGMSALTSAFVVNYLAMVGAMWCAFLLAKDLWPKDQEAGWRSVLLYLFFPFSIFFSIFYSEPLFLFTLLASFYAARKNMWLVAGLFAILVTIGRLPGLIIIPALLVEYFSQRSWSLKKLDCQAWYLFLLPAGFVGFLVFNHIRTGNAFIFLEIFQYQWTYRSINPNIFETLVSWLNQIHSAFLSRHPAAIMEALHAAGGWIAAVLFLVFSWRKLPWSYRVFTGLMLLLLISSSTMESVNRYLVVLFPLFLVAAHSLRNPVVFAVTLAVLASYSGMLLTYLSAGYWVG